MNLVDLIDEDDLKQDDWSLTAPTFGSEGQLTVVGWSGHSGGKKCYILKCTNCSEDQELFNTAHFTSGKTALMAGGVPCGCAFNPKWSKEQHFVRCTRKAEELGYRFLDFAGDWNGAFTKIKMLCEKHGEWCSGNIAKLVNSDQTCPGCRSDTTGKRASKPDEVMITSFFASGCFHPDTKFWRSDRRTSYGKAIYWYVHCPECGEIGEGVSGSLQRGSRPCSCSVHRQKECYINWLVDEHENAVAIKFGVANNSKRRVKQQDTKSAYEVRQYQVYSFPFVQQCKQAERECKKELETGVVLKRDMPDGWTETTWSYNIGKVKSIYERNGGVLV